MTNEFPNENGTNDDFTDVEPTAVEEKKRGGAIGNVAEAWRTRPLFKVMVLIIAIFAVGAAAVNFFGGSKTTEEIARLGRPPTIKAPPGGVSTPYMREQTELANQERAQQAIATGGSALPTPLGQTTEVTSLTPAARNDEALKELRAETEQLKKQMQQQQIQQQTRNGQPARGAQGQQQQQQFDNSLADAMQRQMQQLLSSWAPQGLKAVTVSKNDTAKAEAAKEGREPSTAASSAIPPKIIVNAGTVSYAQLLTEANSDVPGPILAQVVSGPLAGARVIGSFQVANGYEKYLVLSFRLADKKGKDYSINAVALDPDTTLGGLATEVDERYFTRVVLPAAAGFLQGLGDALSEGSSSITTSGTTTIVTQADQGIQEGIYEGLGIAAQTAGQFFQNQANITKPLVRVAAGTPIGIFFVDSVTEGGPTAEPAAAGKYSVNYGGSSVFNQGAAGVPYPGYSTPAYGYGRGYPTAAPYGISYGAPPRASTYNQYYGQ